MAMTRLPREARPGSGAAGSSLQGGRTALLGFIGAGTVGKALAQRLAEVGYPVVAVASRSAASARELGTRAHGARVFGSAQEVADRSDVVFITTPDSAIGTVVEAVRWRSGQLVVHCSGADSLDVLEPARQAGALVGVFHPLQSFAGPEQALRNLPGSTCALEGDPQVLEVLKEMAQAIGCRWMRLGPGQKALYHAAAVMASNYLVTLAAMSASLCNELGLRQEDALAALLPLMKGTLSNVEAMGLPGCLTGPIARGDVATVRKHLRALEVRAPELFQAYRQLALQTLPIGEAKGKLSPDAAERMRRLLVDEEDSERFEEILLPLE